MFGQKITETTGQPVVVENRLGGNGAVAGEAVARSPPDGYTLMMGFHGVNAMLPHLTSKLAFDPNKDFVPVVHIMTVPNILVVNPSVPATSLAELIALAKANPGKLTFASQGVGSTGHIAGELFKQMAGIEIVHVPYRGAAPAAQDVIGGQVTMMFDVVTLARESVKAGKMRALGIAAKERVAALERGSDIGGSRPARARNERLVRIDRAGRHAARGDRVAQPGGQQGVLRARGAGPLRRAGRRAAARPAGGFRRAYRGGVWEVGTGHRPRRHPHRLMLR